MYPGTPESTSKGFGIGPCGERRPRTLAGCCCGLQPYLSLVTPSRPVLSSPWNHSAIIVSYVAVCENAFSANCLRSAALGPAGSEATIVA